MRKPRFCLLEVTSWFSLGCVLFWSDTMIWSALRRTVCQSVREARRLHPDLILMDVALPRISGLEAGLRLRQQEPKVKLLYLSMYGDKEYVEEALRIGASGYVLKGSGLGALFRAIELVLAGKQYVSPELSFRGNS